MKFRLDASPPEVTLPAVGNGLAIADFNGDGRNDAIVALEAAGQVSIALYAGRGDFSFDPPFYVNGGFSAGDLMNGHFTSDNRLGIAVVDIDSNRVVTYLHR